MINRLGMTMHPSIESLHKQFTTELQKASSTSETEALKVKYLGKKGPIQDLMKLLKEVPADQRPEFGKQVNDLKEHVTYTLLEKHNSLLEKEESSRLIQEKIDITLPGRKHFPGQKHVIIQTLDKIIDILSGMGFAVQYGPEIDTDYYNFEALNFPHDHPARDMQDTFYIAPNVLLRTQTTNVQTHLMEKEKPPIRIIAPGKAFRNETITARSHVFFHQVDGFYVDKGVTFADLFATLQEFMQKFFSPDIQLRFRPSYFPFVEPGLELDVSCMSCSGSGCNLCKYSGWLEVAGAGMVHPEVLKTGDIDPEIYTGYAWGMGVERLVMLKHQISDIRMFTQNDVRFLRQFSLA